MNIQPSYIEQLRAYRDEQIKQHENKQAIEAKRSPPPKLDYFGLVCDWWQSMPPRTRNHPWSLEDIAALAFKDHPRRPALRFVAQALRQAGFTERRDWARQGRNKRLWYPPTPHDLNAPI